MWMILISVKMCEIYLKRRMRDIMGLTLVRGWRKLMMINDILNDKFDVNDKKREIKTMINLIKMIKKTPGMTNA